MNRLSSPLQIFSALCLVLLAAAPSHATWSIVLCDSEMKEVAIGTVTCLNQYDLLAIVPVVVVGKGAAAVQAAGDFDGQRRRVIWPRLQTGVSPQDILAAVALISGHQQRQYGIADTQGRMVTFTGSQTFQWAGGVIGSQGSMVYAIQGNILAGDCVVPAIEAAILNTPGDFAEKLMAGMEAAYEEGGDGRCSCSPSNPTSCGCPPATFTKSGHIGGMIVARIGDEDDPVCSASGCADGDYFMRLNVAFQSSGEPDPVLQLRDLFDAWRAALIGRPDAIQSTATFTTRPIAPNGLATTTLVITLRDFTGNPVTTPMSVTVEHAPGSAGLSTVGPAVSQGNGVYWVELTAGVAAGIDQFRVTVDDGIRPVVLMPNPSLEYFAIGDMNCDRLVDNEDIDPFVLALVDPSNYASTWPTCNRYQADINRDGLVDNEDIDPFVALLTGP